MEKHPSNTAMDYLILLSLTASVILLAWVHLSVNNPSQSLNADRVIRLKSAEFLIPDSQDARNIDWTQAQTVTLPHVWAEQGLMEPAIGAYRIRFDLPDSVDFNHVYIPRVGVNGHLWLNGTSLPPAGDIKGERIYRPWNKPHLLELPTDLARPGRNELIFFLNGDRVGFSGLSSLYIGGASPLFYFYSDRTFFQNTFASVSVALTSFAAIVLLLVFFQFHREGYLLWLALFFVLLSIRIANFSIFDVPKNSDAFERSIYSLHFLIVAFSHLMTLSRSNIRSTRWALGITLFTAICLILTWTVPQTKTLEVTALLTALSLPVSLAFIAWMIWKMPLRSSGQAWLHIALILVYFAMALNDWAVISFASRFEENLTSHYLGTLAVAVIILYLLQRYIQIYRTALATKATLQTTIHERDVTIAKQVEELFESERRRLTEQQGRLLMSEMHDGIGGVLINLRLMLRSEIPEQKKLHDMVQRCIDELRMTLVAVDPDEASISGLLAQIRADFQGSASAAGIDFVWNIDDSFEAASLSPLVRLHISRIIQEALTNALKHSGCSCVEVIGRLSGQQLSIVVRDNGKGLPANDCKDGQQGIGLRSIRNRSSEAGLILSFGNRIDQPGFEVSVQAAVDTGR